MASLKLALAVDANNPNIGDIYLGADSNDRLTNSLSEEVAQLLYTRFRFFRGEWFLDSTIGVPYYQTILGQKVSIAIVTRILRQVVTTCPGVASLQAFNLVQQANRAVAVTFSCTLTDGTTLTSDSFAPFVLG
jgi:hypothetical protein